MNKNSLQGYFLKTTIKIDTIVKVSTNCAHFVMNAYVKLYKN